MPAFSTAKGVALVIKEDLKGKSYISTEMSSFNSTVARLVASKTRTLATMLWYVAKLWMQVKKNCNVFSHIKITDSWRRLHLGSDF